MMRSAKLRFLMFNLVLLSSCQPAETVDGSHAPQVEEQREQRMPPEKPCGKPVLVDVRDHEGKSAGVLEAVNDHQYLWLVYSPNLSNRLIKASLYLGTEENLPRDGYGHDLMTEFPLRVTNQDSAIGWIHRIPLDSLPECFVLAACLHIADRELVHPLPSQIRFAWAQSNRSDLGAHSIAYCPSSCDPVGDQCPGGTGPGQFCTHPPGRWVDSSEGQAQWKYLEENFSRAFPDGLTVGCEKKLHFGSALHLGKYLGLAGAGKELAEDAMNPGEDGNGLAAEICALSLSIGFDEIDARYCKSPMRLSRLMVATGPFAGWYVTDLRNEANAVLGGCASNYSAGQMEQVIKTVNENFSGGTTNRGFLRCEGN